MKRDTILRICIVFVIIQATFLTIHSIISKGLNLDVIVIPLITLTFLYIFGFLYTKNYEVPIMVYILGALLAFFYVAGLNLYIGGERLTDTYIIILRYDYFVHALAPFIMVFVLYFPLKKNMKLGKKDPVFFYVILALCALGIAAGFEINELFQVLFFGKAKQVGDYMNNAFDLFFGLIGSSLGTILLYLKEKRDVLIKENIAKMLKTKKK